VIVDEIIFVLGLIEEVRGEDFTSLVNTWGYLDLPIN